MEENEVLVKDDFYGVKVEYPMGALFRQDSLLHKFIKNDYFVLYCRIVAMSKENDGWFEANEETRGILSRESNKSDIAIRKILRWMVDMELLDKSKRGWYRVNFKYVRYV